VKRWLQKTNDKEDWLSIAKDAKAFKGPYSQGINKQ
jgi:hypothetical protein